MARSPKVKYRSCLPPPQNISTDSNGRYDVWVSTSFSSPGCRTLAKHFQDKFQLGITHGPMFEHGSNACDYRDALLFNSQEDDPDAVVLVLHGYFRVFLPCSLPPPISTMRVRLGGRPPALQILQPRIDGDDPKEPTPTSNTFSSRVSRTTSSNSHRATSISTPPTATPTPAPTPMPTPTPTVTPSPRKTTFWSSSISTIRTLQPKPTTSYPTDLGSSSSSSSLPRIVTVTVSATPQRITVSATVTTTLPVVVTTTSTSFPSAAPQTTPHGDGQNPPTSIADSSNTSSRSGRSSVGGRTLVIIGAIAALSIIITIIVLVYARRKRRKQRAARSESIQSASSASSTLQPQSASLTGSSMVQVVSPRGDSILQTSLAINPDYGGRAAYNMNHDAERTSRLVLDHTKKHHRDEAADRVHEQWGGPTGYDGRVVARDMI